MRVALLASMVFAFTMSAAVQPAHADTAQATCAVRESGKAKPDASGACSFSQRQGYVDITLANGITHSLSPLDAPNHYKDKQGHGVVRTTEGDTQTYKWDKKKIVVTFGTATDASAPQVGDAPSDLKDLVGGPLAGGEVDDELTRRGWAQAKSTVEGSDVWSYWKKGNECVAVHLDAARKVASVAVATPIDCKS